MLKVSFLNIALYYLTKYVAFYVLLMFKNKKYDLLKVGNISSGQDLFYYLWIFLFLPVVGIILFSVPLYYSFKVINVTYFSLIIVAVLVVEYFVYTYLASQSDLMNGVYNGIISVVFLLIFFYKAISNFLK